MTKIPKLIEVEPWAKLVCWIFLVRYACCNVCSVCCCWAADQLVCKQWRVVKAGHWTGSFTGKTELTACCCFKAPARSEKIAGKVWAQQFLNQMQKMGDRKKLVKSRKIWANFQTCFFLSNYLEAPSFLTSIGLRTIQCKTLMFQRGPSGKVPKLYENFQQS